MGRAMHFEFETELRIFDGEHLIGSTGACFSGLAEIDEDGAVAGIILDLFGTDVYGRRATHILPTSDPLFRPMAQTIEHAYADVIIDHLISHRSDRAADAADRRNAALV